jgi:hypothetical protein
MHFERLLFIFGGQMAKVQRTGLSFLQVFIRRFDYSRWHSGCYAIVRDTACYDGTRADNTTIPDSYSRQNYGADTDVNIVSYCDGRREFKVRHLFSQNESTAIMSDELATGRDVYIVANRDQPRLR